MFSCQEGILCFFFGGAFQVAALCNVWKLSAFCHELSTVLHRRRSVHPPLVGFVNFEGLQTYEANVAATCRLYLPIQSTHTVYIWKLMQEKVGVTKGIAQNVHSCGFLNSCHASMRCLSFFALELCRRPQ